MLPTGGGGPHELSIQLGLDNPLESQLAPPSNPHYARVLKQPLREEHHVGNLHRS
jgi:hypothetical protein